MCANDLFIERRFTLLHPSVNLNLANYNLLSQEHLPSSLSSIILSLLIGLKFANSVAGVYIYGKVYTMKFSPVEQLSFISHHSIIVLSMFIVILLLLHAIVFPQDVDDWSCFYSCLPVCQDTSQAFHGTRQTTWQE